MDMLLLLLLLKVEHNNLPMIIINHLLDRPSITYPHITDINLVQFSLIVVSHKLERYVFQISCVFSDK